MKIHVGYDCYENLIISTVYISNLLLIGLGLMVRSKVQNLRKREPFLLGQISAITELVTC